MTDFQKIEKAIHFLKQNFKSQPDLNEVARQVYLSPFHFQRMFKDWAGVSPKKFIQFLTLEYAKGLLNKDMALPEVTEETGLSSTSRLHDLFIGIEGMTPGEYKKGGAQLEINYSFAESPFGDLVIASTAKGICHLAFTADESKGILNLKTQFPEANFNQKTDRMQQNALGFFSADWSDLKKIKLHLKATPFQLKVWQALLNIPFGGVSSYSTLAAQIHHPRASRAVGTAIGNNPVAYLIPCHRVIQSSGMTGEYRWGSDRKTAMLGWERARAGGKKQSSVKVNVD